MPPRQTRDTGRLVYWLVFAPTKVYLAEANSAEDAPMEALRKLGYGTRPWICRDWNVRLATPEEVRVRLTQDTDKGQPEIKKAVARQQERMQLHAQ